MKRFPRFATLTAALYAVVLVSAAILVGCDTGGEDPTPPYTPYTPTTYTLTYDGNVHTGGAVPVDSAAYTAGQTATVLGNTGTLVKTGNEFVGWNTKADGTGTTYRPDASITVTANITLYARWTATGTAYTITYAENTADSGAVPVDTNKYIVGDEVPVLGNSGSLIKADYTFRGWNTQADGLGTAYSAGDTITVAGADIVLYAKWSLTTALHVTYDKNSSSASGNVPFDNNDYAPNATVTVLGQGELLRTDYRFDGWNTSAYGSGTTYQPTDTFTITANTKLYAKWTRIYTVTYNGNGNTGGTVPVDSNSPYASGATVTVLGQGSLVRTGGYRFDGWSKYSSGSSPVYTATQTFSITSDTTLYAKWTRIYTLTYNGNDSDGGTVPSPALYTLGQTVIVSGNTGSLTKGGKIFDGWNTKSDGTGLWYWPGNTFPMGSADAMLYAVWVTTTDRAFKAMTADGTNMWNNVTAKRLAVGNHAIVYADQTTAITPAQGAAIAAKYDNYIYTPITSTFGAIEDVDGNGKVIFLLLNIIDGYTGSGGYVAGYFQSTHMLAAVTDANSNEADMLFMDTNPGFDDTDADVMQGFYSTMAHELQHLIEYSQTAARGKTEKEIWIDEGLSTAAEYIYGTGTGSPARQQNRVDYYNNDPIGSIAYGNNFFVWNGYWELGTTIPETGNKQDKLANYATAYLFFQWLRIHASNGTGIYKEIINSSYSDYQALTTVAYRLGASGLSTWPNLLGNWMLANAINKSSGISGYKNQISTTPKNFPGVQTTYALLPGEGVFSTISGSSFYPGSSVYHISYAGISGTGNVSTSAPYIGERLLTFNYNPDPTGYPENGKIATSVVGGPQASMQASLNGTASAPAYTPPASYPIGFQDKVAEREFAGK